ncbi:hypothetical protein BTM361_01100 [Helicobacter pylori]
MESDVKEDLEQARPEQELEKLTQEKEQEIKKRKEESIFTLLLYLLFFYSCFILF